MNVETKALIRHRQDRDGRPRTRHSPGRPKGSGESISGVVVPSLVHLDSCRASSGPCSSSRHHLVNGHDDRNLDSIRACPAMKECQNLVF